jgi:C-terminal peptidase prc
MNGVVLLTVLLAPAAPVPASPPPPSAGQVDRSQCDRFAAMVMALAVQVKDMTGREGVTENALIESAIQGLYAEVGLPVPDEIRTRVRQAALADLTRLLAEARLSLGDDGRLAGSRSLFAAMNGFRHATDPLSGLVSSRVNRHVSIEQDFGIGIELEGVSGLRWTIYQAEQSFARPHFPAGSGGSKLGGYFGPVPKPDEVRSPATLPWRVKRVIAGSPAQRAGIKPGDTIIRIDGNDITAENANALFAAFAMNPILFDPQTGRPIGQDRKLTIRRGNAQPFTVAMKWEDYDPETAFGVMRHADGKWDCMIDRQARIGYIRIGPLESGLDIRFAEMLDDLKKQGCRGLILDLRWCPGGYVDPGTAIAGMFLKEGSVVAKMRFRNPARVSSNGDLRTRSDGEKCTDIPLVVLVGHETTGGGELIAAALRDHDRCVVLGQRTAGRASIQNTIDAGFAGVQFRLTTGTSLRPNGKNRQRKPNSQPTDDWGVRPDAGLEVAVTADKSAELRLQAELQSLRPFESKESLPFDDPAEDPFRLAALVHLRKMLAAPVGKMGK